jgi:hypothetical protein
MIEGGLYGIKQLAYTKLLRRENTLDNSKLDRH